MRAAQLLKLGVAPDHACFDSLNATRRNPKGSWLGAPHKVRDDGLVNAFDGNGGLRLDIEHAAHLAVGVVTDAQRPGRRGLFHARGNVDRIAADAVLAVNAAA